MLRATLAALLLGRHPAPTALHSTALRQSNGQQQERGWKKPWSTGSQIPLTHALFFNVVTHIKSSYTPRAGIRNIQFCCWHVVVETNDPWTYAKPVVLQNKNLLIWEDVILKVFWTVWMLGWIRIDSVGAWILRSMTLTSEQRLKKNIYTYYYYY